MKFKVKDLNIRSGGGLIIVLNQHDAECLGAHAMDRAKIQKNSRAVVAVIDIAESVNAVMPGQVGMFEEVLDIIHAKNNDEVRLNLEPKPESANYIKKKLDGHSLTYKEYLSIIKDIVDNRLTTIELTTFVLANYINSMSEREVLDLTKAMIATGQKLNFKGTVADLHSIGGVPGNRTTPIVVAIVSASGLTFPKTSSRAITSPAGTADTMETVCKVDLSYAELRKVVKKTKACLAWGGAVQLAPADDRIIRIESPLGIDAEGQMLASIMAKKASVGATHLLMEIPVGKGAKATEEQAVHLKRHFENIGEHLKIKTKVIITDGSQPIGNGVGPVLEMIDCLKVLKNKKDAPKDLKEKSILLSGILLEMAGKAPKGEGTLMATKILESGKAMKKFEQIVKAQKGKIPKKLLPAKHSLTIKAPKKGRIVQIDNLEIARIARLAGSPIDKGAGILLHVHKGDNVRKGSPLATVYSSSNEKLKFALKEWKKGIRIR